MTTGTVGGVEVEINVTIIHWSFSCKIREPLCKVVTNTPSPRTQKKKRKKEEREPHFMNQYVLRISSHSRYKYPAIIFTPSFIISPSLAIYNI